MVSASRKEEAPEEIFLEAPFAQSAQEVKTIWGALQPPLPSHPWATSEKVVMPQDRPSCYRRAQRTARLVWAQQRSTFWVNSFMQTSFLSTFL